MRGVLGYDAGQEIALKFNPSFAPIPDVIAAEGWPGNPYPTDPFEVVIEILSPEDSFSRALPEVPPLRDLRHSTSECLRKTQRSVFSNSIDILLRQVILLTPGTKVLIFGVHPFLRSPVFPQRFLHDCAVEAQDFLEYRILAIALGIYET